MAADPLAQACGSGDCPTPSFLPGGYPVAVQPEKNATEEGKVRLPNAGPAWLKVHRSLRSLGPDARLPMEGLHIGTPRAGESSLPPACPTPGSHG